MSAERWAVVLAGGVGSRFWPLSTPERPKQLLPLIDEKPLLVGTIERLTELVPVDRTLVLTNATLASAVAATLPSLPAENVIAEPRPAGTAAALAYAAAMIERRAGSDAVMICVHADWAIGDAIEFRRVLTVAANAAISTHGLITVGIVPTRPDPGFGYIEAAGAQSEGVARRVARFVEKPTRERAAEMVAAGYLWNSGIFAWRVGDFLDQIRTLTPEVEPALRSVDDSAAARDDFFGSVTPVSVDVGVLERSSCVYVVPGDFGWDDIGTWAALHRIGGGDAAGNILRGRAFAIDASNNVVHANGGAVVLFGVEDLVVVTRGDLTVVTTRDRSADLKDLIAHLPPELA